MTTNLNPHKGNEQKSTKRVMRNISNPNVLLSARKNKNFRGFRSRLKSKNSNSTASDDAVKAPHFTSPGVGGFNWGYADAEQSKEDIIDTSKQNINMADISTIVEETEQESRSQNKSILQSNSCSDQTQRSWDSLQSMNKNFLPRSMGGSSLNSHSRNTSSSQPLSFLMDQSIHAHQVITDNLLDKIDDFRNYVTALKIDQRIVTMYKKIDERIVAMHEGNGQKNLQYFEARQAKGSDLETVLSTIQYKLESQQGMIENSFDTFRELFEDDFSRILQFVSNSKPLHSNSETRNHTQFNEMLVSHFSVVLMNNLATAAEQNFKKLFLIICEVIKDLLNFQWNPMSKRQEVSDRIQSAILEQRVNIDNLFRHIFKTAINNVIKDLIPNNNSEQKQLYARIHKLTNQLRKSSDKKNNAYTNKIIQEFNHVSVRLAVMPFISGTVFGMLFTLFVMFVWKLLM